jgi:hypothetical protein
MANVTDSRLLAFVRRVILDTDTTYTLREEALDLLLSIHNVNPGVTVRFAGLMNREYTLDRKTYDTVSDLLNRNMKINAIKELRTWYYENAKQHSAPDILGLKEAKDTIDNWEFGK